MIGTLDQPDPSTIAGTIQCPVFGDVARLTLSRRPDGRWHAIWELVAIQARDELPGDRERLAIIDGKAPLP